MKKTVYIAGDMLKVGAQMLRAKERDDIKALGLPFYNPADNREINDKANLDNNDSLAEKIVRHDTDGIRNAETLIIEPTNDACGTMVELGQVKGMKDIARDIKEIFNNDELFDDEVLAEIYNIITPILNQKVYPHYEDIRRFAGVSENEDRRSWGVNQYVYGVCLDLTNGKGFYEWEEILEELGKES